MINNCELQRVSENIPELLNNYDLSEGECDIIALKWISFNYY